MSAAGGSWLHCEARQADPSHRLVCFPHAGGSASIFRGWGRSLGSIEVHAVSYPGRAERIAESCPSDLRQLAADIARAVEPLAGRSIALFGHSMGAAVALETARELERRGVRLAHLLASGSRDGELPAFFADQLREDRETAIKHLISIGGTDADMVMDPIFQELVLPSVMSDSRMFRDYAMAPGPILRCPITAIAGDVDEDADRRPWRELTSAAFGEIVVPGGHFYLISDPPFAIVSGILATSSTERNGG